MIRYAVVRFGDEWGVLSERRRIGRFPAQDAALQLGVMLAFEALSVGHEVELLLQDIGGQLAPYGLLAETPAPEAGKGERPGAGKPPEPAGMEIAASPS